MSNNIIELQTRLEGAPDDYLEKEITKPSGRVPTALIFNEIQRRRSMREPAMAKAKGNIMGLQDGGIAGLKTIPNLPQMQTIMAGPGEPTGKQKFKYWMDIILGGASGHPEGGNPK